jgi:superfamily II DNA or RNA helicase
MKDHIVHRLDSAAWVARSEELIDRFTIVDRFGEEYEMFTENQWDDLLGLPRNLAGGTDIGNFAYSDDNGWEDGFVPRDDEQERMVADAAYLFKTAGKMGFIMEAPTGYGKTYLGAAVAQRLGQTVCVITTKQDIMKQWREALSNVLRIPEEEVYYWNGDTVPPPEATAVVALVQSVCKGPSRYPQEVYDRFGFVIVDEVHRMGADVFSQAMWHFPARYRMGLSATPYRKDGRENVFQAHIGDVLVSTEVKALNFKVIQARTGWEVPHIWNYQTKKKGPLIIPWDRAIIGVKYLQEDVGRNQIIANFVRAALKKDRNIVIFSDTVDHLKFIREFLHDEGVLDEEDFGFYVGLQSDVYKRPKKEQYKGYREELREQAASKSVCGATYKMASEATNKPWWDTAVLATSKADVVQIVGRIRREYPDKKTPVVLDLVDSNHEVFATFAKKRRKWYESEGAEVVLR